MSTIVLSVEGALAELGDGPLINRESTRTGRALYRLLQRGGGTMVLLAAAPEAQVRPWLLRERFDRFSRLYCCPAGEPYQAWKLNQVRQLQSAGTHIQFFVDGDPETVASVIESGVDSLLLAATAVPPGRTAREYAPWYDLVETVERQQLLHAARAVGTEDED